MAYVEPNVAVFPTLHMPVHSEGGWQHKYSIYKHTHTHSCPFTDIHLHCCLHTDAYTLTDQRFSLVESLCSRQAGPLQQSSGVRGAICQWKTISGEWSVPLVLMSTAGSLCSHGNTQRSSKAESDAHPSHTHTKHTHGPHTSLSIFTSFCRFQCAICTHLYTHTHSCPHTDAITPWQMDTPCHLTPHPSISHPFQAIHLPPLHRRHWKGIMVSEVLYYISRLLYKYVTLDSTCGIMIYVLRTTY